MPPKAKEWIKPLVTALVGGLISAASMLYASGMAKTS